MLSHFFCVSKQKSGGGSGRILPSMLLPRKHAMEVSPSEVDHIAIQGHCQQLKSGKEFFRKAVDAKVEEIFRFQKMIGKGGFSEVWLAKYIDKPKEDPVAIKMMSKSQVLKSELLNEIHILKAVHNHPFIVRMTSSFQTDTHYGIVMKYATCGTLNGRVRLVRRFSELIARFYAAEIAEGLFCLHNLGIIHRDLNLDNVLIDDTGHVLLSDFGLSLQSDPETLHTNHKAWEDADKCQIPAPELLLGLSYDKTVDWWAFGVIIYRMVVGEYPFLKRKDRVDELLKKLQDSPKHKQAELRGYSLDLIYQNEIYPTYLSLQAKALIGQLLCRKNHHRLGRGVFEENDVTNMDFFFCVDWNQLRDHVVPAPFSDLHKEPQRPKRPRSPVQLAFTHNTPASSLAPSARTSTVP